MSALLERESTDAVVPAAAPRRRGKRSAPWRASIRIARRQVRRTWVSSLLIATLVALPIAGMTGAAVYAASMWGTPGEKAAVELGRMQGWVEPAGVADAGFWQVPWNPSANGYPVDENGVSELPSTADEIPDDPLSALPDGTKTIEVSQGEVRLTTAAGATRALAWGGDVADPRFAGRFDLLSGRAPATGREVLVTPATLDRVGSALGGTLEADGTDYTIVGTIRAAVLTRDLPAVMFADAGRFEVRRWYLPDLALTWPQIQQLNDAGVVAYSRTVVLDPPAWQATGGWGSDDANAAYRSALYVGLGVGGLAAAYMVIMLAGAAFAVSARRQQRALAIAASVGADARDLRRIVRLQGTVLGTVGGLVGAAAGVGLAALVMSLTGNGSATQFWGFHVPWEIIVGILVFAVLVGTAAALAPASGVAKTDAIRALRGARRPQRVSVARPLWGSLMLLVGAAVTFACGIAAAAVAASATISWDSPLRWLPAVGIIVGAIIAQLGIVLSGRWLLWLCSLGLSRLGIAARLASRDAVANGARTVPAFAAIGATVFGGVFALGMGAMITGQSVRMYDYSAPMGTAYTEVFPRGSEAVPEADVVKASDALSRALVDIGAERVGVVERQQNPWAEDESGIPADMTRAVVVTPERSLADPLLGWGGGSAFADPSNNIAVISARDLPIVTGVTLTDAQKRAYEAGAALVFADRLVTDGTVEIAAWSERDWQFGRAPDNIFRPAPDAPTFSAPLWRKTVDAIAVSQPKQGIAVAIAPATARELGLQIAPMWVFASFPGGLTADQRDRIEDLSSSVATDAYDIGSWIEDGPPAAMGWLVPLLAAVSVLVLGASAVALGLARFERRPDDATLAAVGGTASLRRRIGFWQGLVITGFGTLAGAAAGILPPIGFWLQSQLSRDPEQVLSLADIPWWLLAALAVALPLVIAIANWLVPPRHPDLTRRTAIA